MFLARRGNQLIKLGLCISVCERILGMICFSCWTRNMKKQRTQSRWPYPSPAKRRWSNVILLSHHCPQRWRRLLCGVSSRRTSRVVRTRLFQGVKSFSVVLIQNVSKSLFLYLSFKLFRAWPCYWEGSRWYKVSTLMCRNFQQKGHY